MLDQLMLQHFANLYKFYEYLMFSPIFPQKIFCLGGVGLVAAVTLRWLCSQEMIHFEFDSCEIFGASTDLDHKRVVS